MKTWLAYYQLPLTTLLHLNYNELCTPTLRNLQIRPNDTAPTVSSAFNLTKS